MRNPVLALILFTFTAAPAWASYYSVLDTGEVLPSGRYKLTGDFQVLTKDGGVNVGAAMDMGIQDEYGVRALLGAGATDVFVGGLVKWMPVPDVEGQPAMGFNAGVLYGKDGDERELSFRIEPLVSKKIQLDTTIFTPYASLPVSFRMRNSDDIKRDDNELALQLVVGSQLQVERWKNLQFIAEVGVDLDNAPSHVSAGAILYFDEENGIVIE
ncbi:MAG: hypothetical protein AB7G93_09115 [Bdellovibrionales bacterium]